MPFLDPSQDFKGGAAKFGSKQSQSTDIDFDHTGHDLAAKKGDELSKLRASKNQALLDDPLSTLDTNERIRGLQRYLNAYHTGTQLGDDAVLPGTRVKGIRESSSTDSDGSTAVDYFDPHMRGQDRTGK
jgi:hypothetical protein